MDLANYHPGEYEDQDLCAYCAPLWDEPHHYVFSELLSEAITIILN